MVNVLCKWLVYFEKLLLHCFNCLHWLLRIRCHPKMADIRHREKGLYYQYFMFNLINQCLEHIGKGLL